MIKNYFGLATRQLHVFSRELIKPSSPTPSHLKLYNLSSMDQAMDRNYMPIVFFFPSNNGGDNSPKKIGEKSRQLKHSLSKTLAQYYPFAGRLISRACVDCNDQGIEFQESRIECGLSDILKKYDQGDVAELNLVFPRGSVWGTFGNESSLVIIRLNYFDCGGIALAVCLSHRIGDACTFANFMNYWAAVTRLSGELVLPYFVSSVPSNNSDDEEFRVFKNNWVTKRLVFKNTKIAHLKAKVVSSNGQSPTRVEFLTALLYKSAMAADKSKFGSFRPSFLWHPLNMRQKIVPQLPKTTVGNWVWHPNIRTTTESELSLSALTDRIKKGKMQIGGMKDLDGKEFKLQIRELEENNYKFYCCSSICNLEFYKVNFGWGNPVQVAIGDVHTPLHNAFSFSDTPCGDGIEALVRFEEQGMVKTKLNQELEALASLN